MPVTRVERPEDLTADWLTAAVGAGTVCDFGIERIGTGQMSECYRVALTYADGGTGPASVVLKVAASDPVSRQTGLALGLYEREVRFYTDIAPGIGGPVAPCHDSAFDGETGVFHLLLGDAGPAVVGDEIRGATVEQATLALTELGRLHAQLLGDEALASAEWLNRDAPMNQALISQLYAGFVDRYGEDIAPEHRAVCERLVGGFDAYLAQEAQSDRIRGLVHGDYRLDNMLFGQPGADRPLTVVDWQTVGIGLPGRDLAYFTGTSLEPTLRADIERGLVEAYHQALSAYDITDYDLETCWRDYRLGAVQVPLLVALGTAFASTTDRGDDMMLAMLSRGCQAIRDLETLELINSYESS